MAEIPTSNYYSKVESRVQAPSQNPAYDAQAAMGRAKFALSETAVTGALGMIEGIAGLIHKINTNRDAIRGDEMASDLAMRYVELENEALSPNTAYTSAEGYEKNKEALQENRFTIERTHAEIAEYENLIAQDSGLGTSNALGRITSYRAKIDGAKERLRELGYEGQALGQGKKQYEMAGDYYEKMLKEFEQEWGLEDGDGGFSTKQGRDRFISFYREQKTRIGDDVHDKIIQYEIPEQARRQRQIVEKYAALGQWDKVIAAARAGTERGLWSEYEQNVMLDEMFYNMGYDLVQSTALDTLKQFEPGMDNWLLDETMYEDVKERLGERRTFMYENHDGSLKMLSKEDQENIKKLADNEWKRIQTEHLGMKRDASFEMLNEGLMLLSQNKLTEQFLRDKRGEAYQGGIYTDGVSQHLRSMIPKGKDPEEDEFTELRNLIDNPEKEAHIMARAMNRTITDESLSKYVLTLTGGWGMSYEQSQKVLTAVKEIRKATGDDFPSEGFDGAMAIESAFKTAKDKAIKDENYERYAQLSVDETNAYSDYYSTIVKNLANDFYFTENGLDALKKLPTNVVRKYLDDDIGSLIDDASSEVAYTNIGAFADGVTTSELEKMQFLIQNNNSHGYTGALSQVLVGMRDVYTEKFANATGVTPRSMVTADNTIEMFVPGGRDAYIRAEAPDNKYLSYSKDHRSYGTRYTFHTTPNQKKLQLMVYDVKLNEWTPVEKGSGLLYVDLYETPPPVENRVITNPPRQSAQQREEAEILRRESADKRTEEMIEAWRQRNER